ncbi:MAG TPA: PEP-CTERM sorting domain-containing protein [Verrucomicrobiota bacterium]|jgi:hypothetical protein|nr:PEP-CTERM sorting domain-containing protein [Verrucomicrobiota bacterium]HOX62012.1 PEP-CTERM sorting domain-containing protein [Verrucomicrobiota bacterium]HPI64410.1 PEP-CTERM sorting domain-containing protein [Verrucomicrobiota bacterium]
MHASATIFLTPLALAMFWLGLAATYGQGTIVYGRLTNPYPPSPIPPPWDESGYPVFSSWNGLVLDFNGDGQADVGFYDDDVSFHIYGIGPTRVLTYPPIPPDVNSFLPVLASGAQIGPAPPDPNLIWRAAINLPPNGQPYSATYNGAWNTGYGGLWQGVEGYTGVEFYIGPDAYYAWIRVGVPLVGIHGGYIYDYAWETRAGVPILAGTVPEPSAWALFGFGISVLVFSRRRCLH